MTTCFSFWLLQSMHWRPCFRFACYKKREVMCRILKFKVVFLKILDESIIYSVAIEEMYAIYKQRHSDVGHRRHANINREAKKNILNFVSNVL